MSWLAPVRRSRSQRGAVVAHTPGSNAPATSAATAVLEPPTSFDERSDAGTPHTPRGPFQISRTRPGRYAIADQTGRHIGTILGDHVIGYTVRAGDRTWRFRDLDVLRLTLEQDLQAESDVDAWGQPAEPAASGAA